MAQLSTKLPWDLANSRWASVLNPLLAVPILNGSLIEEIKLVINTPQSINHLLQRMQVGWFIADRNAAADIWRTKPFNDLTLTLEANANVTINIWVF